MVDDKVLQALATAVQVPARRYAAAERSYRSVAHWLCRDKSTLRNANPHIYVQGSFRLGTAILPVTDNEEYDVDLVCELSLDKTQISQADLKQRLGRELRDYTRSHGMAAPTEKDRCWTMQYADGAQFHLDTLPAIPNSISRLLAKPLGDFPSGILITDRRHPYYYARNAEWPPSNPKGYATWFKSRLSLQRGISIEDMATHHMSRRLSQVIQILKRHRDIMFRNRRTVKPISIIVTTLAAHAYDGEVTLSAALANVLRNMADHIKSRNNVAWISNPVDPGENFADKWQIHPERRDAFYSWWRTAQDNFRLIQGMPTHTALIYLERFLGKTVTDRAVKALPSQTW